MNTGVITNSRINEFDMKILLSQKSKLQVLWRRRPLHLLHSDSEDVLDKKSKRESKRKKKRNLSATHSIPLSSAASITAALCCSPWQCKVTISRWKPIFIRISCIWKRIWGVSCECAGIHILGSQSCQLTWNLLKQWETFCSPFLHPISYYY